MRKLICKILMAAILLEAPFSMYLQNIPRAHATPTLPSPTSFFDPAQEKWNMYFNLDDDTDTSFLRYSVVSTSTLNVKGKAVKLTLRFDQDPDINTVSLIDKSRNRYNTGSYIMKLAKATLDGKDINVAGMKGVMNELVRPAIFISAENVTIDSSYVNSEPSPSQKHTDWGTIETPQINNPPMRVRKILSLSCPNFDEDPGHESDDLEYRMDCYPGGGGGSVYRTAHDISANYDWIDWIIGLGGLLPIPWSNPTRWDGYFDYTSGKYWANNPAGDKWLADNTNSEDMTDQQVIEKYLYKKSVAVDRTSQTIDFSTAGYLDSATVNLCKDKVIQPESSTGWKKFDDSVAALSKTIASSQANSDGSTEIRNFQEGLKRIQDYAKDFKNDDQAIALDLETYRRRYSRLPVPGYPELFIPNGAFKQEKLEGDLSAIQAGYDPDSKRVNETAYKWGLFAGTVLGTDLAVAGASYGLGALSLAIGSNAVAASGSSVWLATTGAAVMQAGVGMEVFGSALLFSPVAVIGIIVVSLLLAIFSALAISQHFKEKEWHYRTFSALLSSIYTSENFKFKDCVFEKAPDAAKKAGITQNTMQAMAEQVHMESAYAAKFFKDVVTTLSPINDGCPTNVIKDPFNWVLCKVARAIYDFVNWMANGAYKMYKNTIAYDQRKKMGYG